MAFESIVFFETGQPNPAPFPPADVHSGIFCYNPNRLITNSLTFAEATSEHRKKRRLPPNPPKNNEAYGTKHSLEPLIKT